MIDYLKSYEYFSNEWGTLYNGDSLSILPLIADGSVDTVFADPPFNLRKEYSGSNIDYRSEAEYIEWCRVWIAECVRILKPGGALFIYNTPKWNIHIAGVLMELDMKLANWIAIDFKAIPHRGGRLYPSHYSLLYFTKGKPKYFKNPKSPIKTCRHCGKELKDYGGYRKKMADNMINLSDVWTDVNPVRHKKFKNHMYNELPIKILERVIQISTEEGETILDPFGGSGTTFFAAEKLKRRWMGIELGDCEVIVGRLEGVKYDG